MYALQLNAIPAWGLQMSLGLRDSMELVQVQKLSPKFPTPHGRGGLLIHLIFLFFFFLVRTKKQMQMENASCVILYLIPTHVRRCHPWRYTYTIGTGQHYCRWHGTNRLPGKQPTSFFHQRIWWRPHNCSTLEEICRISLSSSALPTSLQEKH